MESELIEPKSAKKDVIPAVLKLVTGVAKSAQVAVKGMAVVLGIGLLVFACVLGYFWFGVDARWWLLLPGLLMGVPLLGVGAFVYMLYCVAHLPDALIEAMAGTGRIKQLHADRAEKLKNKKGLVAGFGKLHLTAGLLWDVAWNASDHSDAVGDAQMAVWLFNPLFWFVMMWCIVALAVTQVGFGLFCIIHSFF